MKAIEVKDVQKSFKVYRDKPTTLGERLIFWKRNKFENRPILKGISFTVDKGEAVGLIGSNGCGKSTTLKLLTKIIYPTSGEIIINGKVSALIELGAGFHPDMSGRENIYINASIFGLTRKEIDSKLEQIIEFSGLEDFIDNPVRTYSSGMYSKLAFSITAILETDIMLIDEVLSVGDRRFKKKSYKKMKELISDDKRTVVIVSHSIPSLRELCQKVLWINDGEMIMIGEADEVLDKYEAFMDAED